MLTYSDNAAANATESYYGGSTSGGSALVNALMQSLGLVDTEMYGGYELDAIGGASRVLAGGIPLHARQPAVLGAAARGRAPTTSAASSEGCGLRAAGVGRCAPPSQGSRRPTPATSSTCSHTSSDPGKLDRFVGQLGGVHVLHKAGWINYARHDNGIVLWPGGAILVTVMTYGPAGAGVTSDVLAGEVAAVALRRFRIDPSWEHAGGRPQADAHRVRGRALGVRDRESVSGPGRRYSGNPGSKN